MVVAYHSCRSFGETTVAVKAGMLHRPATAADRKSFGFSIHLFQKVLSEPDNMPFVLVAFLKPLKKEEHESSLGDNSAS